MASQPSVQSSPKIVAAGKIDDESEASPKRRGEVVFQDVGVEYCTANISRRADYWAIRSVRWILEVLDRRRSADVHGFNCKHKTSQCPARTYAHTFIPTNFNDNRRKRQRTSQCYDPYKIFCCLLPPMHHSLRHTTK